MGFNSADIFINEFTTIETRNKSRHNHIENELNGSFLQIKRTDRTGGCCFIIDENV